MTEGGFHAIKHKSSPTDLMKDRAWQSWDWSTQLQDSADSRLANHVVSSRLVDIIHERSKSGIKMDHHERSKSRISRSQRTCDNHNLLTKISWLHKLLSAEPTFLSKLHHAVCVSCFQLLSQSTDFHESWYSKTCLKRTPCIPETWTNGK